MNPGGDLSPEDGQGPPAAPVTLEYEPIEAWPPLAWLAHLRQDTPYVRVKHGRGVETRREWFCEAVWDGEFGGGNFDRTDVVFGSGARCRRRGLVFVSSSTTVDRLHSITWGGSTCVSNSLACLLSEVGARLDPVYPHYMADLRSIVRGLGNYVRSLPTDQGPVALHYAENLHWDGARLEAEPKPWGTRDFSSFARYVGFLDAALCRLAANLAARERARPYRMLGTISSGYDSPTITALARRHGLETVITFPEGRQPLLGSRERPSDDGASIGRRLGVEVISVSRDSWRDRADAPILFLAGDGNGQEVLFQGAERLLEGTVLLTGMSGDTVWGRKPKGGKGLLARGDQSGLSLTEYRLHARFLHVPVPFVGANQADDIRALSDSRGLSSWSVGGPYDRPICRRVVEEAGIERERFGVSKVAASVRFALRQNFWSAAFRDDFLAWIGSRRGRWLRRGRVPPDWVSAAARPVQTLLASIARWLHDTRPRWGGSYRVRRRLEYLGGREFLYAYLFPWAVDRAMRRYGRPGPSAEDAEDEV